MAYQPIEPTTLEVLPSDIFINLLSFLGPKDIISMRKTCKPLATITRERIVWLEAVHRMCMDNVLYEPSFDVHNMTQLELEYLSLGSHRFRRRMQSALTKASSSITASDSVPEASQILYNPPLLTPTHRQMFATRIEVTSMSPYRMHLVPGGRFIVTLNSLQVLEIRDLLALDHRPEGDPNNTFEPCVTIADPDITYFTIHPATDPNFLRIRLRFANEDFQGRLTMVTEMVDVDLSCRPQPVVKRTGKMRIVTPPFQLFGDIFTSVNKDIFVLVYSTFVTVWNCATNMCAQWIAPVSACQFFITDTEIILVSRYYYDSHKSGLYIYKMPPLSLHVQNLPTHQAKDVDPDFIIPFPSDVPGYTGCRGSCDWYTGSAELIWLDLVHSISSTATPFTRIKLVKNPDGSYGVDTLPQSSLGYRLDGAFESRQRMYDRDGKTLAWWSVNHKGSVSCHFGDTIPQDQSQINENTETVALIRDEYGIVGGEAWTSLCAVSGRLAYAAARHHSPANAPPAIILETVIVDYLPTRSEVAA